MVDIHVSKMKWYYHTFYWWPPTYHCNHLSVLQAFPIFHWFGVQCHQVYQVLSDFPLSYLIVCQSCPNGSQSLQVFQGSYLVAFFLSSFLYPFLLLVNKLCVNYFCLFCFLLLWIILHGNQSYPYSAVDGHCAVQYKYQLKRGLQVERLAAEIFKLFTAL